MTALVAERFDLSVDRAVPVTGMGDECEIWKVLEPKEFAVRISPAWRSAADLEWVYGIAAQFAATVPEAVTPLRGADGRSVAVWNGRPVTVWPWITGRQLDRDSPRARGQAAALLARLHSAATGLTLESRRPHPMSRCEGCGHWADLTDPVLDATLRTWDDSRPERSRPVALHGDFYRRNLICQNGTIVGLIDWDELRVDHPEREIAWATWELSKNQAGDKLMTDRATEFLEHYARMSGRTVDRRIVVPMMRDGLRVEVCRRRTGRDDRATDDDYTVKEVEAFWDLRCIAL